MQAKTEFTERYLRVATDLFDGHLREIGFLDLEACSDFVREQTGFVVKFVTKPGSDTWVPQTNTSSSAPRAFVPLRLLPQPKRTLLSSAPRACAVTVIHTTAATLTSTTASTTTSPPDPPPAIVTTFAPIIVTTTTTTSVTSTLATSTLASTSSAPGNSDSRAFCRGFAPRLCCGQPVDHRDHRSKLCKVCTDLYLSAKYNFPKSLNELRCPTVWSQFELRGDVAVCGDDRMRRTLHRWLHISWALPTYSTYPEFTSSPELDGDSEREKPLPLPPVVFERKASVFEGELERKYVESGLTTPTVTATLTLSASAAPSLPYDSSRCDHDCPLCAKQFEGKDCRKVLAKHVRDKHRPNPDHPRFKAWLTASRRSWCPDCASSYSQRQLHDCKGPSLSPEVDSPHLACTPDPEVKADEACILPEWMEIFATSIPSVKRVPQQCRVMVAKSFTTVMRNCAASSTKEQELRAWKLQFLFPKCVLRVQPEVRGGRKKKLKRNETLRAGLLERLKRWDEGRIVELWAEAKKLFSGGERQALTNSLASNIRRATECAQNARYGKAVSSLLSLGLCPPTETTLNEMKSKHPGAELPVLPSGPLPDPVRFDKELVRKKVEGFPTGSAAGASGTRPQFLKDILSCPNKAAGDDALTSLTNLANHLVAGLAPRELAPFVAGAPLMALVKAGGGLRPIAIGETIRRLVSKCCCEATVEGAKVIFGSLQVGVATQGGAEASVHAVRKLAEEFGEDPGRIMLKVDFSNAFNLVNRTEMLAQVYDKLPGLYCWVEYCYSHPAHLLFGTSVLQSAVGVQQGDPLGPLLFSLVLHPLARKIEAEFPDLDLCVWYLDDGTIIGQVDDVHKVFLLLEQDGPALGLHLNVKKNEIWWPNRASLDPFPAEVDRVDNAGVKLLGAPIGTKAFTTDFVKKKLVALSDVCKALREVDNAQVEFALFRGCLSYNKINHLLRTCPPDLLQDALVKFDDHFHKMVAEILRVPCLSEQQWDQASLPVKLAGLGVNQTKVTAASAYVGSCTLTKDLVVALLGRDADKFEPAGVSALLSAHEAVTGKAHTLSSLCDEKSVQQKLSTERHTALFEDLKGKSTVRSHNLLLACSMPHASDWLHAPPIPSLGLGLQSDCFRTAMKFRLGVPLFDAPFPCPARGSDGKACGSQMDVFGDHAPCCHHGPSLVFRHNNVRDILGHAARGAGLTAVIIEKKNQVAGSRAKPGDITVQQYHRGFATSAFDVTVTHPLQKKFLEIAMEEAGIVAEEAHDRKLQKSLEVCKEEGIHFVPLAWESTGGTTETVHETIRKWTQLEGARGGYPAHLIRRNLYAQISCCLQRHLAQSVIHRRLELACERAL